MKFNYKRKKRAFYLIATSDIAFLLLIFLVVTSSLEYSQEIVPPETKYSEDIKKGAESVPIEVNSKGEYSLLSFTFTLDNLSAMLSNISRNSVIKIYADKDVDFQRITQLMDALQADNRFDVFLMMEKNNAEE